MKFILAIDLGTTGNRVIAFKKSGEIAARSYYEFPQIFPKPGWVEHNPLDIWDTTQKALNDVLSEVGSENVDAIGITNQRETTILWDKETGDPVYNAIVWQCRRTKEICKQLSGHSSIIKDKTGLPLDPYFSATKIKWIIDNIPGVEQKIKDHQVIFGTVDTWILWKLTAGRIHATDPSNAARTLCFNIKTLDYDDELLKIFGLPGHIFPEVKSSGGDFGITDKKFTGHEIPIMGILGDQQASLFAHGGFEKGIVKNTYGTGLFVMSSTGAELLPIENLVNTIAWELNGEVTYAIEGSIFIGGACIQWLRDGLNIINSAEETGEMAGKLVSNEGVYFVPALVGLGAPYWDPTARGMIIGITRGTTREHFVRAVLESFAYQTRDVIEEINSNLKIEITKLSVDGGPTKNDFLMQFQADILGIPVERQNLIEMTALGTAGIAGITSGFWDKKTFLNARKIDKTFIPNLEESKRKLFYSQWKEAVTRSLNWAHT
ncbi:glycerol kinase GlpK [Candidatus Dependentiae bacterium]|nr:glycerol kinase GlpK [Candidatus Dependentiae bacterium]